MACFLNFELNPLDDCLFIGIKWMYNVALKLVPIREQQT